MKKFLLALSILTVATLFGCKEAKNEAAKPTKVTVMIYSEYIDPDMITDFEKQTGYKLQIELYEAQEEMISKLQTVGTAQYDAIIASDVVIQQMIHLGLIGKIDIENIPHKTNIADQLKNQSYNPTNEYTVPYL